MKLKISGDVRTMVNYAKNLGWEPVGRNGQNHMELVHKITGQKTRIPASYKNQHLVRSVKSQLAQLVQKP